MLQLKIALLIYFILISIQNLKFKINQNVKFERYKKCEENIRILIFFVALSHF